MSLLDSLLLGLLQGLTEFLPISSSGHLVLLEHYLELALTSQTLQHFDIVLHAGTLLAILLYFRKTCLAVLQAPSGRQPDGAPPLLALLVLATIPVGITGVLGADWIEAHARRPTFVAGAFLITAATLVTSSLLAGRLPVTASFRWKQAVAMGCGQAFAIFPGLSRSGLTLASGRFAGLPVVRATELAFLLGAPALGGAVLFTLVKGTMDLARIGAGPLVVGFSGALVSSLLVMHLFLAMVRRFGLWIWSIYLLIISLLVLADELIVTIG